MFFRFISILLIVKFTSYSDNNVEAVPQLCSAAQRWPLNGRDLVNDYRGNILLLAFMPLDCPICESQLKRFEIMVERLREIRIVVVAPRTETSASVQKFSVRFPSIRIIKESEQEPLWQWLNTTTHDHLIFDRCSRLAKLVRSPNSHTDNFHETFNDLKATVNNANCGHCKYDSQKLRNYIENISPTVSSAPQISAYVVTQPSTVTSHSARNRNENLYQNQLVGIEATARQQRAEILQEEHRRQQEQQQRQRYDEERRRRAEEERQRQLQQQQRQQQQYNTVHNHGPVSGQLTPEENQRRQGNYADTRYSIEKDPRYQQRLEQAQHQRQQQTYANQRSNDYSRAPQHSQYNNYQSDPRLVQTTTPPKPTQPARMEKDFAEAVPLYPDGMKATGDDDYYADYTEWTTPAPAPQQQIPKPTNPSALWPTRSSGLIYDGEKYGGLQLPCNGFTDEICFQQKLQLPETEVHQCCKDRLVITDQCLPGKCSNVTNQLCCIHKFLQSKFACCSDVRQGEYKKPGDQFSRCCYENFVKKEDECCSTIQAAQHWKFVHELCLPNVEVDLSTVKVKSRVPGTSQATIDFDFGKTDKWRFECKYGNQVEQYSYYEEKGPQSSDDGSENNEEKR